MTEDWHKNIGKFKELMQHKIRQNMKEKGTSWREKSNVQLQPLVDKYMALRDWVSAGNILFMIWENEQRRGEAKKK